MNGRAYDYNLGRFLSVDPIIQFPANSQSLNPYSYLMNNPMAGTDPSGYACSFPGPKGSSGLQCSDIFGGGYMGPRSGPFVVQFNTGDNGEESAPTATDSNVENQDIGSPSGQVEKPYELPRISVTAPTGMGGGVSAGAAIAARAGIMTESLGARELLKALGRLTPYPATIGVGALIYSSGLGGCDANGSNCASDFISPNIMPGADFESIRGTSSPGVMNNEEGDNPDLENPSRQKGDRFKTGDDALSQLEEIENAQRKVRQGKSDQQIDSIEKSRQRARSALKPHNIDLDDPDDY